MFGEIDNATIENGAPFVAGTYRKANPRASSRYTYFLPNKIPQTIDFHDRDVYMMLEHATSKVGELNAYSRLVPTLDRFITMHETKEATLSSYVEGTQTTLNEAMMSEGDLVQEQRDDWHEVQNYVHAMKYAVKQLKTRPLATNLIKDTHAILLKGVRGKSKTPGEMRRSQNWIGGNSIKHAHYIPPHTEHVDNLMSDLDNYINNNNVTPHLIKAAIIHYQFETIHPFLDGNGRIGRLLIPLYLIDKEQLDKPLLYISDYIAGHRMEYYESLDSARRDSDIEKWVKYFLTAISSTAQKGCLTLQKVIELQEGIALKMALLGRRVKLGLKVVNSLYEKPVTDSKQIAIEFQITPQTANMIISKLIGIGVLTQVAGHLRNRRYMFKPYVDLFNDDTVYDKEVR
ncbi:MAG: Fic family protein [Bifidobacteriaceae bacterium]|jgi:Fic family protein|nr:Fic family protein [Bifidobacteriaceae bacterium]